MTSLRVPGLIPSRPSTTFSWIYDELLSLTSVGSASTMSPGKPTMRVPPSLIAPLGEAAADVEAVGPVEAGVLAAGGGVAADEHAANAIATVAASAPIR